MKKWTVMMIPDGMGNTRTLSLSSFHFFVATALVLTLCFTTALFYKCWQLAEVDRSEVQTKLETQRAEAKVPEADEELYNDAQLQELLDDEAQKIRDDYAKRDAAIKADLDELYDTETRFREINGLAPREAWGETETKTAEGGVGGPPDELGEEPAPASDALMRPPHVIYGIMRPSPDLIVQEINLRRRSLQELLEDVETQADRLQRTPTFWPSNERDRWISSRFGYRPDPFTNRRSFHGGVDIVAQYGSPVLATGRGVIAQASSDKYKGSYVKIDHGHDLETQYLHLKKLSVKRGEAVERGDTIGYLGNTGRSKGAHIHYEVIKNGKRVNPADYLGKQ